MNSVSQFFLALAVGWCSYMLAMVPVAPYDGPGSGVVLAFMGMFMTTFALTPVFVVGLPIRWVPAVHRWWRAHWWVSIVLALIAVGLMGALLWWPAMRANQQHTVIDWPYPWAGAGGWFLAMFAAAHFYPPQRRESERS